VTENSDKLIALRNFVGKVNDLMDNLIGDCTGFHVPENDFRNFKAEIEKFFKTNYSDNHELVKEFREIVTESKKHKMIYARVILNDMINELEGNLSANRA